MTPRNVPWWSKLTGSATPKSEATPLTSASRSPLRDALLTTLDWREHRQRWTRCGRASRPAEIAAELPQPRFFAPGA